MSSHIQSEEPNSGNQLEEPVETSDREMIQQIFYGNTNTEFEGQQTQILQAESTLLQRQNAGVQRRPLLQQTRSNSLNHNLNGS